MENIDKLIEALDKARSETLAKPPVRLSIRHIHYTTTKTRAEQAIQNIERINRNAPVKITKVEKE